MTQEQATKGGENAYGSGSQIYRHAGYSRTISGISGNGYTCICEVIHPETNNKPAQVIRPGHHRHVSCRSTLISPGYDRIPLFHPGKSNLKWLLLPANKT